MLQVLVRCFIFSGRVVRHVEQRWQRGGAPRQRRVPPLPPGQHGLLPGGRRKDGKRRALFIRRLPRDKHGTVFR
jgi:hypothetical protein